jgi:hypothetical protein
MPNIRKLSGRIVNKWLVSEKDRYYLGNRLNRCEVRKVHDDDGDADKCEDDDDNNYNFFVLTFLTLTCSEMNQSHLVE